MHFKQIHYKNITLKGNMLLKKKTCPASGKIYIREIQCIWNIGHQWKRKRPIIIQHPFWFGTAYLVETLKHLMPNEKLLS